LLSPKKSGLNGYKTYSSKSFQRLKFILSARQLGFSVRDIEQILDHADQGTTACPMVRNLQEQRLQETENQFKQTKALPKKMQEAIVKWQQLLDKAPSKEMICHLIESFTNQTDKGVLAND
jgi:DNA-binding transcriptional MerR regulator